MNNKKNYVKNITITNIKKTKCIYTNNLIVFIYGVY